jgi:plasmid maintenance system killer protein
MRFRINPDDGLRDLYTQGRASKIGKKLDLAIVKAFASRMTVIRRITDERELYRFASFHFEQLERNDEDHSIRLNDKWRLIVALREDKQGRYIWIDKIEDYH